MELATVLEHYRERYLSRYAGRITPDQWSALNAIIGCRTEQYGELTLSCPSCQRQSNCYLSCGHRSCSRCLNHCTTQWLERQQRKLLPVDYYMVTFTLPSELRQVATEDPSDIYGIMFRCAESTIKDFGRNDNKLSAELGMTAVLHTHTRRLDYHPHVHVIVPAGGVNRERSLWREMPGKYLFNGRKLAAVFRGRMLDALKQINLTPGQTPKRWVAQCQRVGTGLPALKYLSKYLYRGVIGDRNIIADDGNNITFRYRDNLGKAKTRCLPGEEFVALLLQHTLPKGFRRVRDYGFLHGNAKNLLRLVQWILRVNVPEVSETSRPHFECRHCHRPMHIVQIFRRKQASG